MRLSGAAVLAILAQTPAGAQELCVTNGVIASAPAGLRRVDGASSRAVVNGSDGSAAELRFRYLGPSADTKPLASGAVRRQIGLKLHAQDACNLIYAMWRIEPEAGIVVSAKLNPGRRRSAECHAEGYANLAPAEAADPPPMRPGSWRVLRAETRGAEILVTVDGRLAWRGALPAAARQLEGPAGLRSDNARFEFTLRATPGARNSGDRCAEEAGD